MLYFKYKHFSTSLLDYQQIIGLSDFMNIQKDILKEYLIYAFDVNVAYRRLSLHYHNHHELFLCTVGSGEQFTENGKEKMSQGDLFFFPAGFAHRASGAPKQNAIGWVVNFGDEIFYRQNPADDEALMIVSFLKKWTTENRCKLPVNIIAYTEMVNTFENMASEALGQSPGSNLALKLFSMKLLLIILRNSDFQVASREIMNQDILAIKVERICEYLKRNHTRQIKVEEVANYFKMSRSHFHAVFLKYTSRTMTQYVNHLRCLSAIKFLQTTNYSLEKITQLSGFGSICSMYQRFILDTGYPVSYYRKKCMTSTSSNNDSAV
jgi:AraC-like DNA-binding protein